MRESIYLLLRYVFLILITYVFLSQIFIDAMITLLTYISLVFTNFFSETILQNGSLFISNLNLTISIVEECIAPAAYILISFIYFTIPIKRKTLLDIWLKSLVAFTVFNLIRIFIMILIVIYTNIQTFEQIHALFYNFLSGIGAALIVLYFIRKEKLKGLFPVVSDFKWIWKEFFSNPKK